MSACKACCGRETADVLCDACNEEWKNSSEYQRAAKQNPSIHPNDFDRRALTDFCNRARAERQNGVPR